MIELATVIGGIMLLCYVRTTKMIDSTDCYKKQGLGMIVVNTLTIIVALPIILVLDVVEDFNATRKMKKFNDKESMV